MQEAISTDPSTPTTVAWVPESWHRPCVVRVVRVFCRFLSLQDFSSGYSRFPLASKPNISKVQFDLKCLQLVGKPRASQVYQFLELLSIVSPTLNSVSISGCPANSAAVTEKNKRVFDLRVMLHETICNDDF